MPPKPISYPYPKAVGEGHSKAEIIGRAMQIEQFPQWGDYMRILDYVRFEAGHKELRFTQYYRKSGGTEKDWVYGQGAGHLSVTTFYSLIKKAKQNPDYGTFEDVFSNLQL